METDDSSGMNQQRSMNSRETRSKYSGLRLSEARIVPLMKSANTRKKTKQPPPTDDCDDCRACTVDGYCRRKVALPVSLIRRRLRSMNYFVPAIKINNMFLAAGLVNLSLMMLLASAPVAQAGFWTFYFPNFLKPSGYKELTDMIQNLEKEINASKDAFQDHQYFWGLMQQLDGIVGDESFIYPEESVCSDVFPLFRDLAIEYAHIDYEHFIRPMLDFQEHLIKQRSNWYPEGEKGKTILPREWEQKLYEKDLSLKIHYHTKLAKTSAFVEKRKQMAGIWRSVKRSLDSSLPCIYLRYAIRQVADDINQQALDSNLDRMNEAMEMIQAAYKRIENYSASDAAAKKEIDAALEKERRYEIRT